MYFIMCPIFASKLCIEMRFLPSFEFGLPLILFYVFVSAALIQLVYTFLVYGKLAFYKKKPQLEETNLPPVSIILSARNESDNLFENLPFILQQNYPEFEVIVVNHQSIDDSAYLLHAYKQQFPNLRIIEIAKNPHLKPGKKLALTLGIKGAKYEHILFTDADCKPVSENWLKSMASQFIPGKEIVLGYGPYIQKKGFLNKLIRFDTAYIAMNYLSMALTKMPYMGVGRNLAYTKTVFKSVNGFKSHYYIPSGDDDLFIQEATKKGNYTINIDSESFCYSEPNTTWESWIRQKTRHYATSFRYNVIKKWLLGIYPLTLLLVWISFVTLQVISKEYRWIGLIVFLIVVILKWIIQGVCFSRLKEKYFIRLLPLWDLFYAVLIPILFYLSERKETNKW
jgi:cellulose synthase/poly-beta-1,6-N-acetylglucosamine synthase-like glycosyltransferase